MFSKRNWIALAETLALTLFVIYLSFYLEQPLSSESPFPWVWFAPMLIALRYGLWFSLLSIALLSAAQYTIPALPQEEAMASLFRLNNNQPYVFYLSGLFLTLTCAMFREKWEKKDRKNTEIANYLQDRIQSISEGHHILQLAYDHLKNQYITRPSTLRSSLEAIRELLANATVDESEKKPRIPIYERLINLISAQCSIEVAGIYAVQGTKLSAKALTSIGQLSPPSEDDFLIQEALSRKEMVYLDVKKVAHEQISRYLVVIPICNQAHKVEAILLVEEMPFIALNSDNLSTLYVIIQYFSAGFSQGGVKNIKKAYPDCPVEFANELYRLVSIQQSVGKESLLIAYVVSTHEQQHNILFRIQREKRGLDSLWLHEVGNNKTALILMPFTDLMGLEYYQIRMNRVLAEAFSMQLNQKPIQFHAYLLSKFNDGLSVLEAAEQFLRQPC